MGMLQCLFLVEARRRIALTILRSNIRISQEREPSIQTSRDPRRGQKLAVFHPPGPLLPPDGRV